MIISKGVWAQEGVSSSQVVPWHKSGPTWPKTSRITLKSSLFALTGDLTALIGSPTTPLLSNPPKRGFQITKWLLDSKSGISWQKNTKNNSKKLHFLLWWEGGHGGFGNTTRHIKVEPKLRSSAFWSCQSYSIIVRNQSICIDKLRNYRSWKYR